jgi:hypothetical protein
MALAADASMLNFALILELPFHASGFSLTKILENQVTGLLTNLAMAFQQVNRVSTVYSKVRTLYF